MTSALNVATGLTEQNVKYLRSRVEKLNSLERIGSLIIDEIYVAKNCEYSQSNGRIYCMENAPTKTLLTVMFKNMAANYEDAVVMATLMKIDSGKIIFSQVV